MRELSPLASILALTLIACASAATAPTSITLAIPSASTTSTPIVVVDGASSGTAKRRQTNDPELQSWAGVWLDPSTAYKTCMTIEVRGSTPTVVSSIEAVGDKETYNVRAQSWKGGTLTWSHFVPSTEYLVTYVCVSVDNDTLRCTWSNDHNASGKEDLTRVESLDAVDDK